MLENTLRMKQTLPTKPQIAHNSSMILVHFLVEWQSFKYLAILQNNTIKKLAHRIIIYHFFKEIQYIFFDPFLRHLHTYIKTEVCSESKTTTTFS